MKKNGENESIEVVSKINSDNIDPSNYFMTLVNAAAEAEMLNETVIAYMQSQIYDILADNIWMYNDGTSTSVTEEIASEMLQSIVFILDCFCLVSAQSENNDRCVEILSKKAGLKKCYNDGLIFAGKIANRTRTLYNEVFASKISVNVPLYNETLNKAVAQSIKRYDRRFFAHKKGYDIDYPTALSGELLNYKGILYIREYLIYIRLENEFCSLFDMKDIRKLINAFAVNNRIYEFDLMENIFEIVFCNAFFSTFLSAAKKNLFIKRSQYKIIASKFIGLDDVAITSLIKKHILKLIVSLGIENPLLRNYIFRYNKQFTRNILSAVKNNYLKNYITFDNL